MVCGALLIINDLIKEGANSRTTGIYNAWCKYTPCRITTTSPRCKV